MNSVTVMRPASNAAAAFTSRQLATIKRTVAKDTNDTEFDLFIEYSKHKGLDPFSRQVIAVVFSKDDAAKRQMTIITSQDGLRVMASRCGDYRPEETEPEYFYDSALKGPTNPLGIEKCTIKLWKQDPKSSQWHPVNGTAYWSEFAPIKRSGEDGFEWVETGEIYPEGHAKAGKPKYKKKMLGEVREILDDSGMWAKMPRNQIAKCARMQALRGGWPETFSGVYAQEEMDRAVAADLTATEMVEREFEDRRMNAISMSTDEFPWVDNEGTLTFVGAGQFGSHVLNVAYGCKTRDEVETIKVRNREGLKRYWAKHKDDALQVSAELEQVVAKLPEAKQAAAS